MSGIFCREVEVLCPWLTVILAGLNKFIVRPGEFLREGPCEFLVQQTEGSKDRPEQFPNPELPEVWNRFWCPENELLPGSFKLLAIAICFSWGLDLDSSPPPLLSGVESVGTQQSVTGQGVYLANTSVEGRSSSGGPSTNLLILRGCGFYCPCLVCLFCFDVEDSKCFLFLYFFFILESNTVLY